MHPQGVLRNFYDVNNLKVKKIFDDNSDKNEKNQTTLSLFFFHYSRIICQFFSTIFCSPWLFKIVSKLMYLKFWSFIWTKLKKKINHN